MPYSRDRNKQINEVILCENDETYALIEQHVGRLRERERSSKLREFLKKVGIYKYKGKFNRESE